MLLSVNQKRLHGKKQTSARVCFGAHSRDPTIDETSLRANPEDQYE